MNKGFGVTVTVKQGDDPEPKTAPMVVVARDERDAELVAAQAAGPNAYAETMRELTHEEIVAQGLDLQAHGSAKVLPILNL
jgi:alpha-beta hydrolase superfamily lysophospholipase